ncbi:hypothetical protein PI125_g25023 [Phytophthora idaei]|nr:hypothetical protein PI125_g25023 [Phytophthora idaei]
MRQGENVRRQTATRTKKTKIKHGLETSTRAKDGQGGAPPPEGQATGASGRVQQRRSNGSPRKQQGSRTKGPGSGDGRIGSANTSQIMLYVLHAGYRLYTLVVERRFKEHLRVVRAQQSELVTEAQLRQKWPDETPGEQAERCKGSLSYWDCKTPAHRERLQQLMKEWIVTKDLPQSEIEQRLRFFHFENTERLLWSLRAAANGERSYSTVRRAGIQATGGV